MAQVQTGNFVVGKNRTALASLYYEIHGNGPEKVCLVMGKLTTTFSSHGTAPCYLQCLKD